MPVPPRRGARRRAAGDDVRVAARRRGRGAGAALRVGAVADDDDVVGAHRPPHAGGVDRDRPEPAVQAPLGAKQHLAPENVDDQVGRHRPVGEAGRLAGLLDIAAGEVARGDHPDDRARLVGDRDEVGVAGRHHQPDVAQRGVLAGERALLAHDVARPQVDVVPELGLGSAAALERPARLRVHLPQPRGDVPLTRLEPPLQLGVADGRGDRVEVRVPVARDVGGRHGRILPRPRRPGSSG